ncbi:MFS transporter [Pacificispira sp.]|uniref:MFS transporter n=1 Tax=Pacificispira sp. TaxID=2888761 RepID=UPI003BA8497E
MPGIYGSIAAILLSIALLYGGNTMMATLLPVRAGQEGFDAIFVGGMGTGYFIGFIIGCRLTPWLVQRVGHIRAFGALAAITASTTLGFALFMEPAPWIVLRFIYGVAGSGLLMIVEGWLNEKAGQGNRGRVLAIYTLVYIGAQALSQQIFLFIAAKEVTLFLVAAIIICLSLVPIAITTSPSPTPLRTASLNLRRLYATSPVSTLGSLGVGLANGAFWSLAPLFAQGIGLSTQTVGMLITSVIIGNAVLQWPIGWLSDRVDRRFPIVACFFGASALGLAMSFSEGVYLILGIAAVYGAFAQSIYAMLVAHAGDKAEPEEFVSVSGGLLLLYGVGALIGAMPGAALMDAFGHQALFWWTASVHSGIAVFILWRMLKRPGRAEPMPEGFQAVPKSTPVAVDLDPRAEASPPPDAEHQAGEGGATTP